jgi:hypothetical protein
MEKTDQEKLKLLEEKLAKYMPEYLEKKKMFRGIKHEDSLSELRYTQFMVYQELVDGLKKEINEIKTRLRGY